VYTKDIDASAMFYAALGLKQAWRIDRNGPNGVPVSLIGFKFPDEASSELVLSDNADVPLTEIELLCDDVRATCAELGEREDIQWIRKPFATESGHVAVMEAPDGNVFVLVGA
jgi:hypothetical protein